MTRCHIYWDSTESFPPSLFFYSPKSFYDVTNRDDSNEFRHEQSRPEANSLEKIPCNLKPLLYTVVHSDLIINQHVCPGSLNHLNKWWLVVFSLADVNYLFAYTKRKLLSCLIHSTDPLAPSSLIYDFDFNAKTASIYTRTSSIALMHRGRCEMQHRSSLIILHWKCPSHNFWWNECVYCWTEWHFSPHEANSASRKTLYYN